MGRWTVERLLVEGYGVTVLNRGATPIPWPRKQVGRLKADRQGNQAQFGKVLNQSGYWDVIVDFTGFQEIQMKTTVNALATAFKSGSKTKYNVGHYIYISTDSVYWKLKLPDDDSRLNETATTTFTNEELHRHIEHYCKKTPQGQHQIRYGGDKLGCDLHLVSMHKKNGFPFTSLRLPDVYGPHDNQGAFWEIAETVRSAQPLSCGLPFGRVRKRGSRKVLYEEYELNKKEIAKEHRVTWVYVADVVDAIMAVIAAGKDPRPGVRKPFGEIFNIAHDEALNVEEGATLIKEAAQSLPMLKDTFRKARVKASYTAQAQLPTTDFGALDNNKAKRMLGWKPRPMKKCIQVALEWYYGNKKGFPKPPVAKTRRSEDL